MERAKRLGVVVVSVLLVTSATFAAAASVAGHSSGTSPAVGAQADASDAPDEADEIYVEENGDAVLVYEEEHDEPDADAFSGEFGFEGERGLIYLLYTGEIGELEDADELEELNTTGSATLEVTRESVAASADVDAEKPEELVDLSLDAEYTQNRQTLSSSLDLATTVEAPEAEDEMEGLASLDAQLDQTVGPSSYETEGSITAVGEDAAGMRDRMLDVTLTETSDGYELEVSEERIVPDHTRDRWETEDHAAQSLEGMFDGIAVELDGTADVTLENHRFEEGPEHDTVALEYSVTLSGVKDAVAQQLATQFARSNDADLNEQEAKQITDRMKNLRFEHVHFSLGVDGETTDVEWEARVENYDEFVLGVVQVAESMDSVDDELADQFDEITELIEARSASGVTQTSSVDLSVSSDGKQTTLELSSDVSSENWGDYVNELEDRDLTEYVFEVSYSLSAETRNGELTSSFSGEYADEELFESSIDRLVELAEEDGDQELVDDLEAFRAAEFQRAKASVSLDGDSFTVESGAKFDDISSLEGYPIESPDGELSITAVHAETDDGVTTFYLTVEEYVGEEPTEAEVRDTDHVGEDTTVHMPDEWDDEDLPSVDVESATEFLEEDEGDSSLLGGTTVTVAIAVLAVLAVIGAVVYRRR